MHLKGSCSDFTSSLWASSATSLMRWASREHTDVGKGCWVQTWAVLLNLYTIFPSKSFFLVSKRASILFYFFRGSAIYSFCLNLCACCRTSDLDGPPVRRDDNHASQIMGFIRVRGWSAPHTRQRLRLLCVCRRRPPLLPSGLWDYRDEQTPICASHTSLQPGEQQKDFSIPDISKSLYRKAWLGSEWNYRLPLIVPCGPRTTQSWEGKHAEIVRRLCAVAWEKVCVCVLNESKVGQPHISALDHNNTF